MRETLCEIHISKRVSLKVLVQCGDVMDPAEVADLALVLRWIAHATQRWRRHGALAVVKEKTEVA